MNKILLGLALLLALCLSGCNKVIKPPEAYGPIQIKIKCAGRKWNIMRLFISL